MATPNPKGNQLDRNDELRLGIFFLLVCSYFSVAATAFAMVPYRESKTVPIERVIKNAEKYVKKHPKDPQGYYVLARIHSFAFTADSNFVDIYGSDPNSLGDGESLPQLKYPESDLTYGVYQSREKSTLSPSAKKHLSVAIENYKKALDLESKNPFFQLGLAWLYEEGSRFRQQMDGLRIDWTEKALVTYRKIYTWAVERNEVGMADEASDRIIAILTQKKMRTKKEEEEIAAIVRTIANLSSKPHAGKAISPIIFSLDGGHDFARLLSSNARVKFDLDGDGIDSVWPWLQPSTSLLVWDPGETGHIESGRQLFGSVTWWVFWRDGYEPLAALDDNEDGWLSERELLGIAVWTDQNCNGVSDLGEVKSIEEVGIKRINTQSSGKVDSTPWSQYGIELLNGKMISTFDWLPKEVP